VTAIARIRPRVPARSVVLMSGSEAAGPLVENLEALDFVVVLASSPGEVVWQLEDRANVFAIVVDGDNAIGDPIALLGFMQTSYPRVRRVLIGDLQVDPQLTCKILRRPLDRRMLALALEDSHN